MNNPYQAPTANVIDTQRAMAGEKLELKDMWLSFQGRIPRKAFWIYSFLLLVPCIGIVGLLYWISDTLGMIAMVVFYALAFWAVLALQVKRFHDRDKSGLWVLIGFVPVIGGLWLFIELGCLRGSDGANRFGGDATGMY